MENKPKANICLAVSSPVDLVQCKSFSVKPITDNCKFVVIYKSRNKETSKR
jgi:hypothetical protein